MKKFFKIYNYSNSNIFILSNFLFYEYQLAIETIRFNNQIINLVKNINKDLNIELKKLKLF